MSGNSLRPGKLELGPLQLKKHCDNVRFLSPRTIIVLALRANFPGFTPNFC